MASVTNPRADRRDSHADALHRNASAHVSTRVDTFGFQYETTLDELAREEDAK